MPSLSVSPHHSVQRFFHHPGPNLHEHEHVFTTQRTLQPTYGNRLQDLYITPINTTYLHRRLLGVSAEVAERSNRFDWSRQLLAPWSLKEGWGWGWGVGFGLGFRV